ncbi:L-lactate dehydrogenase [Streptobacillus ratti]|uniref:L-lactate dehydrogenase n=1 Tax=Streptobacillus ratti TaxID=1720557 RepID=UPI0009329DEF|nr:L-lactate dehydrogenase [Streptobacillus ratti]
MKKTAKVSIIGAGFVGSATTLSIVLSGLASHVVLVDVNKEKAKGEVLDIAHGAAFIKTCDIISGDYKDTKDSDIVIVTAGANQKPGETRLDLVHKNVEIFKTIIPQVARYSPNAVLVIASNPVDILTWVAYKLSGFPSHKVIGTGTVLDTSRLRYYVAEEFDLDARNIHAYIIGEHGDSEFPVWSSANIGPLNFADFCAREAKNAEELKEKIHHKVRDAAYEIISRKGYTNYAIGMAIRRIVEAILRDENCILTISTYNQIEDVYYSIPNIVGRNGQHLKICPEFEADEKEKLENTKKVLKDVIKTIKL